MLSPAQKLYGHPIQDTLHTVAPSHRSSQEEDWQASHTSTQSEKFYNTHAHPLTDINIGSQRSHQQPQQVNHIYIPPPRRQQPIPFNR